MLSRLYKLIFDISVCYTIGTLLLKSVAGITLSSESFLILLSTILISLVLNTFLYKQNRILKNISTFLFSIVTLAITVTFLHPVFLEFVVFLLALTYSAYLIFSERFVMSRGGFVDMLKRLLYLYLLIGFLILMLSTFQVFSTALQTASPYIILTIISAVFLLRHLRADNQMEQMKQYRIQQIVELLTFLLASLLLTLVKAPQNLVEGLKLLYQNLIVPIVSVLFSILGMLISGLIYIIIAAVSLLTNNKGLRKIEVGKTIGSSQPVDINKVKVRNIDWIMPFLYAIGIILAIVLIFFFFRWLMGEKFKQTTQSSILETREYLEDEKDRRAGNKLRRTKDSRGTVRYYYWKCLQLLQHKQVELTPQDTTEEINKKYNNLKTNDTETKKEASTVFMQIYRKARYQMSVDITKEEAEKAKQLYQTIKSIKLEK